MSNIKKKSSGINPSAEARDMDAMAEASGSVYDAVAIMSRRAAQISNELRLELREKLEEFASTVDNLEEVHENKEQIEISRAYERLPNPAILALHEYQNGQLVHRFSVEGAEE